MDAKLKADWIAALRSGEFKQTRGRMFDGEGYCCLGVLCKVAGCTVVLGSTDRDRENAENYDFVERATPIDRTDLSQKNDIEMLTFPQIADWLEANPDV